MALAIALYPDPALRPMHDIDILLPVEAIQDATRRLQSSGRRLVSSEHAPGFTLAHGYELFFDDCTTTPALRIEVHLAPWSYQPPNAKPGLTWFWRRTESMMWQGRRLLVLDPTAQLLHLAIHVVHHGGRRAHLLWYHDIYLLWLWRGAEIDWRDALAQARLLGWEAALHSVLTNLTTMFDVSLPPELMDWLSGDQTQMVGFASLRNLSAPDPTRTRSVIESLRHRSWDQRRRFLLCVLAPHPAFLRARYPLSPAWAWPLLYPYRWLDLALDILRTLLHRP